MLVDLHDNVVREATDFVLSFIRHTALLGHRTNCSGIERTCTHIVVNVEHGQGHYDVICARERWCRQIQSFKSGNEVMLGLETVNEIVATTSQFIAPPSRRRSMS